MNVLPDGISSQVRLFADDTALYLTIKADARLRLFYKIVYRLVSVPLLDYVQYNNRISRYCHSMTFRQVSTSTNFSPCHYLFAPPPPPPSLLLSYRVLMPLRLLSVSCNTLDHYSRKACFLPDFSNSNLFQHIICFYPSLSHFILV